MAGDLGVNTKKRAFETPSFFVINMFYSILNLILRISFSKSTVVK
jgi:hypothetical protein